MGFCGTDKILAKYEILTRLARLEKELYGQEWPGNMPISRLAELEISVHDMDAEMQNFRTIKEQLKDKTIKYEKELEKNKSLENEIASLIQDIRKKDEEKEELEQSVNSLKEQLKEVQVQHEEEVNSKCHIIKELTDEKVNVEKSLENEKRICQEKKEEINRLLSDIEQEKASAKNRENELQAKISELINSAQEKEKEYQDTVEQMAETNRNQESELKKKEESLRNEMSITKQYADKFGSWEADTQKYHELLDAVFLCSSLEGMMADYCLDKSAGAENVSNLIHFIGLLGNETSFLNILYDYLVEYKNTHRQVLTDAERELFSRINAYYQSFYGIRYCMIEYPNDGDRFDQETMRDFDVRNKIFRTVVGVYVPAIRRDDTGYLLLSLVKGET